MKGEGRYAAGQEDFIEEMGPELDHGQVESKGWGV